MPMRLAVKQILVICYNLIMMVFKVLKWYNIVGYNKGAIMNIRLPSDTLKKTHDYFDYLKAR